MVHELADLLQTVHDSEGAASASEKVNAKFRELSRYTKANMNLKGKRSDINALSQQYKVQQDQASQRVKDEFNRLGDIPGAMDALDVEAALQETAAVEAEIQRLKAQNQNNGIQ